MRARSRAMILAATSAEGLLRFSVQTFWVSSWTRRAFHSGRSWPSRLRWRHRQRCRLGGDLLALDRGSERPRTIPPSALRPLVQRELRPCAWVSPLDRGGVDHAALALCGKVGGERDGDVGTVLDLAQAHLPEAIVEPVLHRPQRVLRHAIGRQVRITSCASFGSLK